MKYINPYQMLNHARKALIVVCALLPLYHAQADTSVWQVKSDDSTLYLGGTIHLLRPDDYPLPNEYEQAYAASEELYFEVDISAMSYPSVQAMLQQKFSYNDGRTLQSVLNEDAYIALSDHMSEVGFPLMLMERMKPGAISITLAAIEFERMGYTPEGVDAFFHSKGIGDNKAMGFLETIEDQADFIAAMGEGNESEFILLELQNIDKIDQFMEEMVAAWRYGNSEKLERLLLTESKELYPEIYELIFTRRNLRWITQIEEMLQDAETEFVLVGAGHLVGEDGLIELLRARGYEVTQL